MKRWMISTLVMCALALPTKAQQFVGYVNVHIYAGDNLIANMLNSAPDNTLDNVLQGGVLTGSTFTEWNPVSDQLLPVSVFNGTSWSINYNLSLNETGGVLHSPGNTTVTFVGQMLNYDLNAGKSTYVPPTYNPGTYLLGYPVPVSTASFQDIIGRNPQQGDAVTLLNATTQTYTTTTFLDGTWNHGVPSIPIGQAGYFDLAIPEPSSCAVLCAGVMVFIISRRFLGRR